MTCDLCGTALDRFGACPGTYELLRLKEFPGEEFGTAAQLVHHLSGEDRVTVTMVNNWRRRDGLRRYEVGRTVYSPLAQASTIERDKSGSTRGVARQLDSALVGA